MWEDLYESHYQELLRYADSACKQEAEAEDLTQEVFLKALQNYDTLADLGPSQRRAWLYRTLKNELCDRYRHAKLEQRYTRELTEDTLAPEPGMEQVETAMVLQTLTAQDRLLFTLRYLEGYTASEISQMLQIPPGTVRSRLSRCRTLLKHQLKDYY